MNNNSIVLASKSPRRLELLQYITKDFIVSSSDVEEIIDPSLSPQEVAMELAKIKATEVQISYPEHLVIGADTIVVFEGKIYGKPSSKEDAFLTLKKLSGNTHQVITGVCLLKKDKIELFYESTDVTFFTLSDEEINEYLELGEYTDKAGSYAYQGDGFRFVEKINGDFYNVVGLPIAQLRKKLISIEKKRC